MEYPIITWVAGSFNIEAYCKGYIMVMIKSMCFLYLVMAHFSFCMQLESIIACNGSWSEAHNERTLFLNRPQYSLHIELICILFID